MLRNQRRSLLPETYFDLSRKDRSDLLQIAADQLGRQIEVVEKDIWVVEILRILFESSIGSDLTFKGGTSLSKVYRVIDRFSEDIDLTINVKRVLPDKTVDSEYPPSSSQAGKWKDRVRKVELPRIMNDQVIPLLKNELPDDVVVEYIDGDVFVYYSKTTPRYSDAPDYIKPVVRIEPGGISTGTPNHRVEIDCDIKGAEVASAIEFPRATPTVMAIQRTFWEKATLVHFACVKGRKDWKDYARHWYDLIRIFESKYGLDCINDAVAARSTVVFKGWFYSDKLVDYDEAITGQIQIVPSEIMQTAMELDYRAMNSMFESEPYSFETLINKCAKLEKTMNDITRDWK